MRATAFTAQLTPLLHSHAEADVAQVVRMGPSGHSAHLLVRLGNLARLGHRLQLAHLTQAGSGRSGGGRQARCGQQALTTLTP